MRFGKLTFPDKIIKQATCGVERPSHLAGQFLHSQRCWLELLKQLLSISGLCYDLVNLLVSNKIKRP